MPSRKESAKKNVVSATSTGGLTWAVALSAALSCVATTNMTLPVSTARARPVTASIVRRAGARDIQLTCGFAMVLPRLSVPLAVNVSVSPRRLNLGFAGATLRESSLKRTTTCAVPFAEPPPAPLLASIVAVPSATPRMRTESPAALTIWAIPVARLCHTSPAPGMSEPLASRTAAWKLTGAMTARTVTSAGVTVTDRAA